MKAISHLQIPGHRNSRPDTSINPAGRVEIKRISDFSAELQAQWYGLPAHKQQPNLPTTAAQRRSPTRGRR